MLAATNVALAGITYNRLVLRGVSDEDDVARLQEARDEVDLPRTLPVDEVLMLVGDDPADVARATAELLANYDWTDLFGQGAPDRARIEREITAWKRDGVPALFLTAAKRATEGRSTPAIGPYLERVRFTARGQPDEVPDFLALAAWCLDQALGEGRFQVRECPLCRRPFLSAGRARFCQRLAPGTVNQTCQDVGKVREYRQRRREARREASDA